MEKRLEFLQITEYLISVGLFGNMIKQQTNITFIFFLKKQPDLNYENPDLRQEIYDMMDFWFKKGIDGFRLDAISQISKDPFFSDGEFPTNNKVVGTNKFLNGIHVHQFLQEMNKKVFSKYDFMTVCECPGVTIQDAIDFTNPNRHEMCMLYQFDIETVDTDEASKFNLKPFDFIKYKTILNGKKVSKEKLGIHFF